MIKIFINKLNTIMPKNEAEAEVYFILESFNISKNDVILNSEKIGINKKGIENIIDKRLSTKTPLQYLLNTAYFYNKKYYVNENVLIPRPETELLVKTIIDTIHHNNLKNLKILDIGTGSGCIACTLALNLKNATITACDISKKALQIAKKNYKNFQKEIFSKKSQINFIISDIFENIDEKFDIIVSNPPYIPYSEHNNLQDEVKNFEPEQALFAKDDGLFFYKKITEQASNFLNENGYIAFELGINQSEIIRKVTIQNKFLDQKIIKDFNSIDRILVAKKG